MNLDFAKVCGKHNAIYEAYYKQIDPKGSGAIEAMTAAKFLKKSGLSDVVLSRIWDLSDPNGKGYLDKPGFFVALKLVSLAQAGQVINMSNIYTDTMNPPKVGDLPKIMPPRIQTVPIASGGVSNADWSIKVIDRLKYEQLFESLKPVGGMLPGNKVKGVLMDSKLPMETLGKIWDLADQDKDGNLDKHEFIVAMHLVYQTLEKRTVPDVLPPELRKTITGGPPPKPAPPHIAAAPVSSMPRAPSGEGFGDGGFVANFPKDIAPPPAIVPLPTVVPSIQRVPPVAAVMQQPLISTDPLIPIGAPPSVTAAADWVVTPSELKRYEVMFRDSDRDKDGLVSGLEVKNVFLQSGVPQNCLAHIWALCDTNQSGKLSLEQFALAMWMVERKQKGIEPPQVLNANMVPPSMRGIISGVDIQPQEPKPTYSNPELEMISKEIEELAKERRALETEIAQKEADIRIKSGEVRSLQSELDTLSATLKQLEHQRGEAQKRLDDLKSQSSEYQETLAKINLDISQMRNQVNKIREQCQKQEETINEQEGELNSKRSELQKLKDEEAALQKEYEDNNKELQNLTKHLQNTQLQISSVRSMVTQLMETQRQMTDALLMCRAAIESNDTELVSEYQLKIEPDFDDARKTLKKEIDEARPDPFEDNSSNVKGSNGFTSNGFNNDPFVANSVTTSNIRTGFDDSFNVSTGFDSGFDAFGSSGFGQQKDPFGGDAFGANKSNAITPEIGKDDFGSDPFAALHAPTGQGQVLSPNTQKSGPPPRPESPSPALPPKKSKVPPPRPAPPRPLQAPSRPTNPTMDAFGASTNSSGFADFADFDNKQSIIAIPKPPTTAKTTTQLPSLASTLASSISLFQSSTSSSTSSSNSTALTTATTTTNHLNRSNTPLQNISTAFTVTGTGISTNKTTVTPLISGPTDFSDDPFKDYRYEDPFNIKDPFADDDDDSFRSPENIFKDEISSDGDGDTNSQNIANTKNISAVANSSKSSTSTTSRTYNSAMSITASSNEFLEKFDALTTNASPVPSAKSSASGNGVGSVAEADSIMPAGGSEVKSQRNTPSIAANLHVGSDNVFDDFADFDAFATKSSNAINNDTSDNVKKSAVAAADFTTNAATKTNDDANDSFFDAFNDNFIRGSDILNSKKLNTNIADAFGDTIHRNGNAKMMAIDAFASSDSAFDAFSTNTTKTTTITKSSKVFDINENAFEDNFFNKSSLPNEKNLKLQKIQNNRSSLSKTQNNDLNSKFSADYSNPDSFDADLEEAIKRSMLEK